MKQNSTNIYISNCTFYHGMGFAVGSIGQYPNQIEVIESVTAEDIIFHDVRYAGRMKTWTGLTKGYPPNGGGGGTGHARNITFRDWKMDNVHQAFMIEQCISYNGQSGGCDTSIFEIMDMHRINAAGTLTGSNVATFQFSQAGQCSDVQVAGINLRDGNGTSIKGYLCSNVDAAGFSCTGSCDSNAICHE